MKSRGFRGQKGKSFNRDRRAKGGKRRGRDLDGEGPEPRRVGADGPTGLRLPVVVQDVCCGEGMLQPVERRGVQPLSGAEDVLQWWVWREEP